MAGSESIAECIRRGLQRAASGALLLLGSLVLACCFASPAHADDGGEPRVVRVAFSQQAQVMWTDAQGVRSGYTYEYLERIAQYAGWDYEFVPVEAEGPDAYFEAAAMLEADEVDLISGAFATGDNAGRFSLSDESYATLEAVLLSPAERSDPWEDKAGEKLRVAVANAPALVEDLRAYAKAKGVELELIECADRSEQNAAVRIGSADVLLTSNMNALDGMRVEAHCGARPEYFAMQRGSELASELSQAMERINDVDATFGSKLFDKYFSETASTFVLTDAEQAFVRSTDVVRVGVRTNQQPYQYEEDGELRGIAVNLLDVIAKKAGLEFEYVRAPSRSELDAMLQDGRIDMVAVAEYDFDAARIARMGLTQPYVTASYVLVANDAVQEGVIEGKRLALSSASRYNGDFVGDPMQFESVPACVQAVIDGDADYTYADEYVVQYFMNTPEFRGIRMSPQTYEPHRLCFGVVRTSDSMLLGILDKAVGSLSETERQAVINANVLRDNSFDAFDYLKANPLQAAIMVTAAVLVVVVLVLIILYQRTRAKAKTAMDMKKRLRMYTLCDDHFFEYDWAKGELMVIVPGADEGGAPQQRVVSFPSSPKAPRDERLRAFADMVLSDTRRTEELQSPGDDGEMHWVRVTVEPVRDEAGHLVMTMGKVEGIDEERNEKDELIARAEHDSLTRVLNAETMRQRIKHRMSALQGSHEAALLVIDIDNFKDVNDRYGHLAGDHVLKAVARLLRESFRTSDVVGRLGGDEFMVYLDYRDSAEALQEKCDAVRLAVEHHAYETASLHPTVSIGGVFVRAGETFNEAYRRADDTLYEAKNEGRNRCTIAPED